MDPVFWEHDVRVYETGDKKGSVSQGLCRMGARGWELVAFTFVGHFESDGRGTVFVYLAAFKRVVGPQYPTESEDPLEERARELARQMFDGEHPFQTGRLRVARPVIEGS